MSVLKIYNTLARDKQVFVPIEPGKVRLYVCGMTVYDFCHLGHARVMVVFDMIQRWLRAQEFDVIYVRNITDIDDKIIRRAVENKESISALTQRYINAMHEDAAALGVERPDHEPRATDYVPQMLNLIGALEKNGLAYQAKDGDVNFSVRDFAGYGKLSGKSLDDLRAGERVDVNNTKRDPLDFVLWKASREEEPQEVKWDSKWGSGRPGFFALNPGTAEEKTYTERIASIGPFPKGTVFRSTTGGGGGWGSPLERDPQLVLADIRNGFIDAAQAQAVCRVVVVERAGELAVDQQQTDELRAA